MADLWQQQAHRAIEQDVEGARTVRRFAHSAPANVDPCVA